MGRHRLSFLYLFGLAGLACVLMTQETTRARAASVEVSYNGLTWTTTTYARDVSEFLIENFGSYDSLAVMPAPETPVRSQLEIRIEDTAAHALDDNVAINLSKQAESIRLAEAQLAAAAVEAQPTPKPPAPKPAPAKSTSQIFSGTATWYRHGSGLTVASRRFPKGTKLRVIAVNSGKSVDVVVNDYGPQAGTGVELDLNEPAFSQLASLGAGKIQIKYHKL